MEKIAIITDSCSDIKKEYRELYDIHVLPIQIQYDGKSYRDGVDITSNDIYAIQDEKVIKTSSPVGEDLFNLLDQLKDKEYTHVIGLFLSSGISGTGNQMRLFCQTYEKLKCHIVDSQSASVGLGVIAVSLAKYREEGKSFDELIEIADFLCHQNYAYFSIDDLNYLQKGGRIGKASAFLGTTLKIKPILSFEKENGEIYVPAKVESSKVKSKLIDLIESHLEENPHQKFALAIADANNLEERNILKRMLKVSSILLYIDGHVGAALSCYLGFRTFRSSNSIFTRIKNIQGVLNIFYIISIIFRFDKL